MKSSYTLIGGYTNSAYSISVYMHNDDARFHIYKLPEYQKFVDRLVDNTSEWFISGSYENCGYGAGELFPIIIRKVCYEH